jgi:hypothetical protein
VDRALEGDAVSEHLVPTVSKSEAKQIISAMLSATGYLDRTYGDGVDKRP